MFRAAVMFLPVLVVLSLAPADAQPPDSGDRRARPGNRAQRGPRDMSAMFQRFDANKDGVLQGKEIPPPLRGRMARIDANKDGKLTLEELKQARGGGGRTQGGRTGEVITGAAKGERHAETLKVGDTAPDFTLPDPGGKRQVTLSSFAGKKPVVLIFGSYT